MKPTPLVTLALVLPLAFAGCTSAPAAATHLHIAFGSTHAPVDADVRLLDCPSAGTGGESTAASPLPCTAMLQLRQWSENGGLPIETQHFAFGDCLGRIDGIPAISGCEPNATSYWSLAVNGVDATVGADQLVLHSGDRVDWTLTQIPQSEAGSLQLRLDPTPPTRNATTVLHGWVSAPATVIVMAVALHGPIHIIDTVGEPRVQANGNWSMERPVKPGETRFLVIANARDAQVQANQTVVRLAKGTMQVDFKGVPGHAARDDEVWFDPDSYPSASYYEGQAVPHPEHANVHDLMVAWSAQTSVPIIYKAHSSFGQQVMQIDGVGDPSMNSSAFWCYTVNAETASFGITEMEFKDGDVVAWHLGIC